MQKEKQNLSKYGKSFQEKLVNIIVNDKKFCEQIREVLDPDFFDLKYLSILTEKIFAFKKKYDTHPTKDALFSVINSELKDDKEDLLKASILSYLSNIKDKDQVEDELYVRETSLDFCKKQKLVEAIVKSANLVNTTNYNQIKSIIENALKLGENNSLGHDYDLNFEDRFLAENRDVISTGWPEIDRVINGGLGNGELSVIIAPTGAGKSFVLVHLGAQALLQGKNVIHYTLELKDR